MSPVTYTESQDQLDAKTILLLMRHKMCRRQLIKSLFVANILAISSLFNTSHTYRPRPWYRDHTPLIRAARCEITQRGSYVLLLFLFLFSARSPQSLGRSPRNFAT